MESLDPAIRTVWRIKLLLWTLLVLIPVVFYEVTHLFAPDRWLPTGLLLVLVLVVGGVMIWWLPRLRYRYWRYALGPEELVLERGVLVRVRTIVPLRRVQHLDIAQDLIEREFGLARIVLHTAGTRHSAVVLPGLRQEQAEALRDEIKRYLLEETL